MTEAQAHEFLSKCKRRLLWRKDISDAEAIEKLKRGSWPFLILMTARLILTVSHGFWNENGLLYWLDIGLLSFCLIFIGVLIWTLIRVSQAQRALNQS